MELNPTISVNHMAENHNSPFKPYDTTTHRVTKGRYITSSDPRGYVPVYEYPLNNQWIMMDADDGYVLWTGIWKALGNSKADVLRMVEAEPELAQKLRRVRGGYLKIQGTWLPFEIAMRLARRVAWPIRYDLVPLFGPTFPDSCLAPDQPGFGQPIENLQKRKHRRAQLASSSASASGSNFINLTAPPTGPDRVYMPYMPAGDDHILNPNTQYEQSGYTTTREREATPSSTSGSYFAASPAQREHHARTRSPGGRHRFNPYSPTSTPAQDMAQPALGYRQPRRHSPDPSQQGLPSSYTQPSVPNELPPIAAYDSSYTGPSTSLPPIGSIRDIMAGPDMDASTALRRLRLGSDDSSKLPRDWQWESRRAGSSSMARDVPASFPAYQPSSMAMAQGTSASQGYSTQRLPASRAGSPSTATQSWQDPGRINSRGVVVPQSFPGPADRTRPPGEKLDHPPVAR